MKDKLPEVGEICFFHDEPIDFIATRNADYAHQVGEFFIVRDGAFITRDNYGFKYCTPLGVTHEAKDDS